MYLALKHTHITCALISILLFTLRGYWMLVESPQLRKRWVRILPHIIDTALLSSAIAMTVMIDQYPFATDWLTAKLVALIIYIVVGTVALKRGKSKAIRTGCLILALISVVYIVAVALSHNPAPWQLL